MAVKYVVPKEVIILGRTIPVMREPLKGAHGQFHRSNFTISLNTDCPAHLVEDTLLHECMHAVLWISGVSQLISEELEEAICFASESLTNVYRTRK